MEKDGVPYKYEKDSGILFQIWHDNDIAIFDSYKAFHIRWRSRRITAEEAKALAETAYAKRFL
jgi:hypothetical protein